MFEPIDIKSPNTYTIDCAKDIVRALNTSSACISNYMANKVMLKCRCLNESLSLVCMVVYGGFGIY